MSYTSYNPSTPPPSGEDAASSQGPTAETEAAYAVANEYATTAPDPKYFPPFPINNQLDTNLYAGAPYYYDYGRRSWIFYIPGTELPGPPSDPEAGNVWIDQDNNYLMYIYNEDEMLPVDGSNFEPQDNTWYALTTNKRAYDYLLVAQAEKSGDINITVNPSPTVNILGETLMYFNTVDGDLKVRLRQTDASTGEEYFDWVSVTQRALDAIAVDDPNLNFNHVLPAPMIRRVDEQMADLQKRIDAVRDAI